MVTPNSRLLTKIIALKKSPKREPARRDCPVSGVRKIPGRGANDGASEVQPRARSLAPGCAGARARRISEPRTGATRDRVVRCRHGADRRQPPTISDRHSRRATRARRESSASDLLIGTQPTVQSASSPGTWSAWVAFGAGLTWGSVFLRYWRAVFPRQGRAAARVPGAGDPGRAAVAIARPVRAWARSDPGALGDCRQ
jgi:hypothetical protein